MAIECYEGKCPYHGAKNNSDEGPYCYESICRQQEWINHVAMIIEDQKDSPLQLRTLKLTNTLNNQGRHANFLLAEVIVKEILQHGKLPYLRCTKCSKPLDNIEDGELCIACGKRASELFKK